LPRQARRIVETAYAEHLDASDLEVTAIYREALFQLDQSLEELAALSENSRNDAVRLGALKVRFDVLERRLDRGCPVARRT
jgi:ribosomal protein S4